MERYRAYRILKDMEVDCPDAEMQEALRIALHDVKFVDLLPNDLIPVVHGRWLHNDEYVLWAEKYVCSVCNCNAPSDGDYRHNLTNYCLNCGAKMDLEVDGE